MAQESWSFPAETGTPDFCKEGTVPVHLVKSVFDPHQGFAFCDGQDSAYVYIPLLNIPAQASITCLNAIAQAAPGEVSLQADLLTASPSGKLQTDKRQASGTWLLTVDKKGTQSVHLVLFSVNVEKAIVKDGYTYFLRVLMKKSKISANPVLLGGAVGRCDCPPITVAENLKTPNTLYEVVTSVALIWCPPHGGTPPKPSKGSQEIGSITIEWTMDSLPAPPI
ncbi:MAG TPA: hypothetical protein VH351_04395 [Bryobacteraceae bacterium]|jgi:hypothetical protein|nr:hypothetical protein [Bryobacteraceae bacterium]